MSDQSPKAIARRREALRVAELHSEVGASGRQRWSICPGSRALIRKMPKHPSSAAAQWGTDAHEHAEKYLRHVFEGAPKPARIADEEMRECVKAYVEKCNELLDKYTDGRRLASRIWVEVRFTLPNLPDAYGTVDFMFYVPELKLLVCVDLKTGTGIMVAAQENPQLLYYATAAMFQEFLPVATAHLVIHQPRAMEGRDFSEWPVTGERLYSELGKLRNEILATERPDAPLVSGDHCVKSFCPAMATCPERRREAHEIAATQDFGPLVTYPVEDLVRFFKAIPRIKAACEAVSQFLHAEAYAGRVPAGLKIVNKNLGDRKWIDEAAAAKALEQAVSQDLSIPGPLTAELLMKLYTRKFISPAQAEKLLAKTIGGAVFKPDSEGALVKRESTGTTLVAESDNRPAAVLDGTSDFAAQVATQKEVSK